MSRFVRADGRSRRRLVSAGRLDPSHDRFKEVIVSFELSPRPDIDWAHHHNDRATPDRADGTTT